MVTYKTPYFTYDCHVSIDKYVATDGLAISLWNEEDGPIARVTVCLPDYKIAEDEAFVDTNNNPGIMEVIEKYNLGKMTGGLGLSGWCSYPCVKFNMTELRKHE